MLETENTRVSDDFSTYGKYTVVNKLFLSYPGTKIKLNRTDDGMFSYYRKNIEDQVTEKIISRPSDTLDLEICPILPLNLPARKTNDLMFLRFEKQVYVSKNSTIDVFAPFPIEIGVFVQDTATNSSSLLDCFTCKPIHSRFGLYGTPENGSLCMYAKVPLEKHREPFVYALTKISIINNTTNGTLVGKIVFPVTEHNMYYTENTADAYIDDLSMIIQKDYGKNIAKVNRVAYTESNKNWKIAPRMESKKEVIDRFLMDRGID